MKIIRLNADERIELEKTDPADQNKGGFQGFMVDLQNRVDETTGQLVLSDNDIRRIERYASYTQGGYQNRLRRIFSRELGTELSRQE